MTTPDARSRWGLLRDHGFRQLFLADVGSQAGAHVWRFALPLVAILALDATEAQVGLLAAAMTVAIAVVGLPAGAIVDRYPRRAIMIGSDLARAGLVLAIPVFWWLDALTMTQLYVVALLVGVFSVLFDAAYQSYLPHLVGRANLVEANAKLEAVYSVSLVGGRAAGGPLVQLLTAPVALITTAVGFASSAVFLRSIRVAEPKVRRARVSRIVPEIAEGLRFVVGHRLLRPLVATVATVNLFLAASGPVLLLFLARTLELDPVVIGLLLALGGVGAVAGSAVANRLVLRFGHGRVIWTSLALTAPSAFVLPWAEADWRLVLVGLQQVVFWAGILVNSITQVSLRQLVTADAMLGRMNATVRFLVWGLTPVGAAVGGILAGLIGTRQTLLIVAAGSSLAFLWALTAPLRHYRAAA